MVDINNEWYDFSATVVHNIYQPLSVAQEDAGVTATIVTASYAELQAGAGCPVGHVFGDKSTVLSGESIPTTTKDKSEMNKDDKKSDRNLEGNVYETVWHESIREDLAKAPKTKYSGRKVYINPRWDMEAQIKDFNKDRPIKIKKIDESSNIPEWIRKAYGKK